MVKTKKYTNEELIKKIYQLRTHKGLGYEDISREIEEEFNVKIGAQTIKGYYENYVSRANAITSTLKVEQDEAKEVSIDWHKKFSEKFDLIDQTISTQMKRMTKMLDTAYSKGDEKKYVKLLSTLLSLSKDLQNQLGIIKNQQENIITSQKNVVYSPLQVMGIINKELQKQIKEGKIKLIDKDGKVKKDLFENQE